MERSSTAQTPLAAPAVSDGIAQDMAHSDRRRLTIRAASPKFIARPSAFAACAVAMLVSVSTLLAQPTPQPPAKAAPKGTPATRTPATAPKSPALPKGGPPAASPPATSTTTPLVAPNEVAAKDQPEQYPPLPPNFQPRPMPPAIMTLEKPMFTDAEEQAQGTSLRKEQYQNVLRAGELNASSRQLIRRWAKWRVYSLSLPKYLKRPADKDKDSEKEKAAKSREPALSDRREDIRRELGYAAQFQSNPSVAGQFRTLVCQELLTHCNELLDNNFYVRINVVLLVSDMNLVEPDTIKNVPAEAFTPAAETLLLALTGKDQPEAVKIVAAKGIRRIGLYGAPITGDQILRNRLVTGLVAELENRTAHPWYQMRLVEALGEMNVVLDLNRRPSVVDALAKVLVDPQRHWIVRSEAARSLGRVPLSPDVNVGVLSFLVVRLGREMADAYNKDQSEYYWKRCFYNVALTFRFRTGDLQEQRRHPKPGLLLKAPTNAVTKEAADQLMPVVRQVLQPPSASGLPTPIALESVNSLNEWLNSNKPASLRLAPTLEPLAATQAP